GRRHANVIEQPHRLESSTWPEHTNQLSCHATTGPCTDLVAINAEQGRCPGSVGTKRALAPSLHLRIAQVARREPPGREGFKVMGHLRTGRTIAIKAEAIVHLPHTCPLSAKEDVPKW